MLKQKDPDRVEIPKLTQKGVEQTFIVRTFNWVEKPENDNITILDDNANALDDQINNFGSEWGFYWIPYNDSPLCEPEMRQFSIEITDEKGNKKKDECEYMTGKTTVYFRKK